eukprot:g46052.t1
MKHLEAIPLDASPCVAELDVASPVTESRPAPPWCENAPVVDEIADMLTELVVFNCRRFRHPARLGLVTVLLGVLVLEEELFLKRPGDPVSGEELGPNDPELEHPLIESTEEDPAGDPGDGVAGRTEPAGGIGLPPTLSEGEGPVAKDDCWEVDPGSVLGVGDDTEAKQQFVYRLLLHTIHLDSYAYRLDTPWRAYLSWIFNRIMGAQVQMPSKNVTSQ